MKKLSIVLLTFFLLVAMGTTASAARTDRGTYEMSGALAYGTGPEDFDNDIGINLGFGYMMKNIENLQARIDISYYQFDRDVLGASLDYTRIPINLGGRYYFPMMDRLDLFAEAGLEISVDDVEVATLGGGKASESEVNLGFTPGGGAEYFITDNIGVFALGRFHVVSDDYFSLHLGGAYHF